MGPDGMSEINAKDDLFTVPKLQPDGKNWVMYKTRLLWSQAARGLTGHFTGDSHMIQS